MKNDQKMLGSISLEENIVLLGRRLKAQEDRRINNVKK
jgi:hypothetical protein